MSLIADRNIITCKTARVSTLSSRSNTSWGEFNGTYRISYVPKFSGSLLLFDFYFGVQTTTDHILQSWRLYNITDSAYLDNDGNYQDRNWVHAQSRGQYNYDNATMMHVQATYSPSSTAAKTYGLYHRDAGGGSALIGFSASNGSGAVHWRHSMQITVYEIEA